MSEFLLFLFAVTSAVITFLAGCTAHPDRKPPHTFPPGLESQHSETYSKSMVVNEPSASTDTPLCGTAAREAQAMAAQNYPQPYSAGSSCTQNACFNPQTGTYIASDGTQRVCR